MKAEGKDIDVELKAERLWTKAQAEALVAKCLGQPGIVTEESKPTTQVSPALYDLTTLQREANSRFGFSAKNTLGLAQALYDAGKYTEAGEHLRALCAKKSDWMKRLRACAKISTR